MKKWIVGAFFVLVLTCAAQKQASEKLWVSIGYERYGDRVLFIQDLETKTRCYAVTSDRANMTGYAISCVRDPGVNGN